MYDRRSVGQQVYEVQGCNNARSPMNFRAYLLWLRRASWRFRQQSAILNLIPVQRAPLEAWCKPCSSRTQLISPSYQLLAGLDLQIEVAPDRIRIRPVKAGCCTSFTGLIGPKSLVALTLPQLADRANFLIPDQTCLRESSSQPYQICKQVQAGLF